MGAGNKNVDAGEFVIERVFAAPREMVFAAWTEPKQMSRWWGPHGFTNPVCQIDARSGGAYRIVMRSPEGVDYPMKGHFSEVKTNERLVFAMDLTEHPDAWHEMIDPERIKTGKKPAIEATTTVTFEDREGQTLVTVRMVFESEKTRQRHEKLGMPEGWGQSFERLDSVVRRSETAERELFQTRIFDAPRKMVFDAWTDPKKIVQWWGPVGFTTTIDKMEVKSGGAWEFVMHGPDGRDYVNTNRYVTVERPRRIVFDHLSEPRHRMTATFVEMGGKTSLSVHMVFESKAQLELVEKEYRAGEGLKQTLGRLGELLAK